MQWPIILLILLLTSPFFILLVSTLTIYGLSHIS